MKKSAVLLILCTIVCFIGSGCYSPKPIPKAYFDQEPEIGVAVGECPEKAQMRDSGQGGLIGAMVTAGRAGKMKEAMEGIIGDTVKELVRQKFEAAIEDHFDVYEEGQLQAVIDIQQWGWYLPTALAGIKTGSYQFTLSGMVTVTDSEVKKKKGKIATCMIAVSESIGDKPTAATSQEALLKCADKFATEAVAFLTTEKNAPDKK
jgi:hypothetical protein